MLGEHIVGLFGSGEFQHFFGIVAVHPKGNGFQRQCHMVFQQFQIFLGAAVSAQFQHQRKILIEKAEVAQRIFIQALHYSSQLPIKCLFFGLGETRFNNVGLDFIHGFEKHKPASDYLRFGGIGNAAVALAIKHVEANLLFIDNACQFRD